MAGTERPEPGGPADRPAPPPPESPTELGKRSWWGVLKRTVQEFREDQLTDWAAALTYYGILSLFPALLVLVSAVGLAGAAATAELIRSLNTVAPGPAQELLTQALGNVQRTQRTAGVVALVGLAVALWSASGYIAAFIRAANSIYEVEEGRPFWKLTPLRLGVTLLMVVLLVLSTVMVVFTGRLADQAGRLLGLGPAAVTAWGILKWPVLVLIVSLMIAILYWVAPNVRQPGFRWISPGSVLAVVLWLIASGLFAFYVANFGSYNKTYGALAGVVVFLVWLWISNNVILLGAEFDAELQRARQIEAGHPPEKEPFLEPRDTRKIGD
ncbi:Ribonuclease BN [Carbonactinospora thermoautotrophica]|uniref:Ribonuclease BN n=1 Tax=Carbonactinospora thermoautotrophica TaxID=1469144 RepID=A0A132MMT0_9ACTN|nr:YihY/virulence factor BrkB family protein [Carbonactinospora thermoautotrophica]KWW98731.1 Ribonuclease BN [Carbonactinospora thermoautotrophica]